ncbi:hypothetical protein QOZ80_4AG0303190 [Eleusine coracana subsp. coracana]|nr:hypothetical protein QOZ80_4AG0303190 [Eleusine coracana subsp. coracana]
MEVAVTVSAARWVLGMALSPVMDGLLEVWAASSGLGPNVEALKMELLYAQAMLDNAQGREIRSPALKELLLKLRQLAYNADDVLDELDYFRIQDELQGTHHAADVKERGCVQGLILNARHTAKAVGSKLIKLCCQCSRDDASHVVGDHDKQGCPSGVRCSCCGSETSPPTPSPANHGDRTIFGGECMAKVTATARSSALTVGKLLPCCCCSSPPIDDDDDDAHSGPPEIFDTLQYLYGNLVSKGHRKKHDMEIPKLKFDRVEISKKMMDIVEQLKPICAKVSTILNLELVGSNRTTIKDTTAMGRPETTPLIVEQSLYGRDKEKKSTINGIIQGEYFTNELTVLPIVGPGDWQKKLRIRFQKFKVKMIQVVTMR